MVAFGVVVAVFIVVVVFVGIIMVFSVACVNVDFGVFSSCSVVAAVVIFGIDMIVCTDNVTVIVAILSISAVVGVV